MQTVEQCTMGLRSVFEYLVTRSIISYPSRSEGCSRWSVWFNLDYSQQQIRVLLIRCFLIRNIYIYISSHTSTFKRLLHYRNAGTWNCQCLALCIPVLFVLTDLLVMLWRVKERRKKIRSHLHQAFFCCEHHILRKWLYKCTCLRGLSNLLQREKEDLCSEKHNINFSGWI